MQLMPKITLVLLFFLFLTGPAPLVEGFYRQASAEGNVNLSVTLSQKQLRVNQSAALTLTITGAKSAEIELPQVDNLLFQRRGQSRKIEIINGDFTASVAISYHIRPLQEGKYTIPPMTVNVDGEVMKTEPLSLTVIGEATGQDTSPGHAENPSKNRGLAFLSIENLPEEGYRGQLIPVTIKAYFRQGIRAEIDHLPAITGASYVLTPLDREPLQSEEVVDGTNYSVLTWRSSISAIKTGRHPLQFALEATLLIPAKNRPTRGIDPFFDDDVFRGFFDRVERKNVNLQSTAHMLDIAALPEDGRPADFDGAVGNFSFTVDASPRQVEIGEPITLTMTVSGEGNFDTVTAPVFPMTAAWKTYSPVANFDDQGEGYRGTKTFEQAIVPTSSAVQAIPRLDFSYFDPAKGNYVTITTDPLALDITGAVSALAPSSPPQTNSMADANDESEPPPPTMDQYLTSSSFTPTIIPVFQQFWFIVLTVLTTLALLTVMMLQVRKRYRAQNHALLKMKVTSKMLAEKEKTLQMAVQQGQDDLFLKTCREMIRIHLAHTENREAAALTLSDLRRILPVSSPLIEIFGAAQEHAYGGRRLTVTQMEQYRQLLRAALENRQ